MKSSLKKKWIEALRSGEYQQGCGAMRRKGDDGADLFCCLGVLADVAGCKWTEENGSYLLRVGGHAQRGFIPDRIAVKLGLGTDPERDIQGRLADMNDKPRSFKRIASYIERYL